MNKVLAILFAQLLIVASTCAANFPFIRLNSQTNRLSDNGTALTRDGVPVGANSSPFTNSAGVVQYSPGQAATNLFQVANSFTVFSESTNYLSIDSTTGLTTMQNYIGGSVHGGSPYTLQMNSAPSPGDPWDGGGFGFHKTAWIKNDLTNSGGTRLVYGFGGIASVYADTEGDNGVQAWTNEVAGVIGQSSVGSYGLGYGVIGSVIPYYNNQISIGVAGSALNTGGYIGTNIGGYFETSASSTAPVYENAVLLLDNRNSGAPLIIGRTNNGTHVFAVGASGTLIAPEVDAAELYTGSFKIYSGTLTPADAGVTLDFGSTNRDSSLSTTGNVTLATANLAAGKCYSLRIIGCSTNSQAAYPAGWHWYPTAQTNILASKWHRLSLRSWGTTDADVEASLAQEQ